MLLKFFARIPTFPLHHGHHPHSLDPGDAGNPVSGSRPREDGHGALLLVQQFHPVSAPAGFEPAARFERRKAFVDKIRPGSAPGIIQEKVLHAEQFIAMLHGGAGSIGQERSRPLQHKIALQQFQVGIFRFFPTNEAKSLFGTRHGHIENPALFFLSLGV